ncbi:MAG: hypothetical protein K6C09_00410 [Oscillospiraceae bacterium]|nr:hypothetical protein [Oscillospiraceae bacterium]
MKVIDVYAQYFEGACVFNGVPRHAASVKLTATSDAGEVFYEVSVSFFPHNDPEDFAVSYDACGVREIYRAKGRRAKKREAGFMENFRAEADAVAAELGGTIDWEKPLIEARWG